VLHSSVAMRFQNRGGALPQSANGAPAVFWGSGFLGTHAETSYRLRTMSTAFSSCVSLPPLNASRESSIVNLGTMPLFSSILPCQVR
jgi:hypothetical protein